MAQKARLNRPNGDLISASEACKNGAKFYCATPNCPTEMFLVSQGTQKAHFRSKSISSHISIECVKNSIVFDPDKYDKNLNIDYLKSFILKINYQLNIHNHTSPDNTLNPKVPVVIGKHRLIKIRSLSTLYYLFVSSKLDSIIEDNICINDIFVCRNNYLNHTDLSGFKIVEATIYKFEKDYIYFNVPRFFRNEPFTLIRVLCRENKLRNSIFSHARKYPHLYDALIVLGIELTKVNSQKYTYESVLNFESQYFFP